jgi:hypothetical protein
MSFVTDSQFIENLPAPRASFEWRGTDNSWRLLFAGAQDLADVAQAQTLIMPQFKNHALAGRQPAQGAFDTLPELHVPEVALRIGVRGILFKIVHTVERTLGGIHHGRLFLADLPLAQIIQANVRHDAVEPGMEAAIEPERIDAAKHAQERFLKDVTCVFLGPQQVDSEPKHTLVVSADKLLESVLIAALNGPDQAGFI